MTGRTHDLTAFTLLNVAFATHQTMPHISVATLVVAFGANMIGGLLPDIDQSTANIWDKIRAGRLISKIVQPFVGRHRTISHSIIGMLIVGYAMKYLLSLLRPIFLVDMEVIWWSFMIGYFSHLFIDMFTTQGVPWLFPIPWHFGIPPIKFLRIKTGGLLEKFIVYPSLIFLNLYLLYSRYPLYVAFFKSYLR